MTNETQFDLLFIGNYVYIFKYYFGIITWEMFDCYYDFHRCCHYHIGFQFACGYTCSDRGTSGIFFKKRSNLNTGKGFKKNKK